MSRGTSITCRLALIAALAVGASVPLRAVGTVTVTSLDVGGGVTRYTVAWTSTAGGAVSTNRFSVKSGTIIAVKIVPSAVTAPTDLYDVTLVDVNNIDVLNSLAANQSATLGKYFVFDPPLVVDGTQQLDVVVANAGNATLGTVTIWVR